MADKPSKTTKRRVKNPETFRERAIKAAESSDSPTKAGRLRTAGSKVATPVSAGARKISGSKAAKPLKKPSKLIGRILLPKYFRDSWQELKLVTWPSWSQSRRLTFAVIIFAIIFGLSIAGVDWVLDKIFRKLLLN